LERPRRRWEDGIKMDLTEIGWGGVEWMHLAQDRDRWRAVVNAVMNLRVLARQSQLINWYDNCCYICKYYDIRPTVRNGKRYGPALFMLVGS
jgi:hypothetical protein